MNRVPRDVSVMDGVKFGVHHASEPGGSRATFVVLSFELPKLPGKIPPGSLLIYKLPTPEAVSGLIATLREHAAETWPGAKV